MANLKEAFVQVLTSKGAFKSECAVQIKSYDGKQVSLFTDKHNIKNHRGAEYLVVHVVSGHDTRGKKHLLLPTETFETSSRWIDVSENDVQEVLSL